MISSTLRASGNTGCVKALLVLPAALVLVACGAAEPKQGASAGDLGANLRSGISADALTSPDASWAKYHPVTQSDEAAVSDLGAGFDQQGV
jgi:hypothetical protein